MIGEEYVNYVRSVPLSRNTVSRRICSISQNIENLLISRIQGSSAFSLQLDETTDIAHCCQLIAYVRYIYKGKILEDFLFCKKLEGRANGEKVFEVVDNYFKCKQLDWKKCLSVCTDGAAALTGNNKGLRGLAEKIFPHIKFTHCIIHRQALVAKDIDEDLHKILQSVIKVINYIKSSSLNCRLFSILCNEMGSAYESLLLHTEVRWLSRGRILRRIFELRNEVYIFLKNKKHPLSSLFIDDIWTCKLCYLVDIFEKLNDLNTSLQGENSTILSSNDKIDAFTKKLSLWKQELEKDNINMFSCLSEYIFENKTDLYLFKDMICNHLKRLNENFLKEI